MKKKFAGAMLALGMVMFAQNPDNTKANKRDRGAEAATADKQGNSQQAVDLTRQIRKHITADDSLSTYAKNVKVISKDGSVTLRGPVRSADEKAKVEQIAKQVAGAEHVTSDLEVAAK